MKSYKDLEIYQISFDLALKIRELTLKLESCDKYEVGGQIRRSSQSIKDTIVEGWGRRKYKADFIKFLIDSYASHLEAKSQAEFLHLSVKDSTWLEIAEKLDALGIKIHNFIKYVENNWKT
ncbi:MAG: four helix bundle protein [Bacteroidetes bacterium]|nr:four helix bundle protein [Bacteroidota bacterium]MBL6944333.1 four helix bundle protein [Bacteroidales bacterium]